MPCNYSKRKNDPECWYKQQEFYTDYKWRRILITLGAGNPVVTRVLSELSKKYYA
jgi:spore coat polysaccharide biosynthesis predicted glycosyltransferase SpsG